MKDKYQDAINIARAKMLKDVDVEKNSFIKEIKNGLGEKLIEELTNNKPPSRKKLFWDKFKRVIGL